METRQREKVVDILRYKRKKEDPALFIFLRKSSTETTKQSKNDHFIRLKNYFVTVESLINVYTTIVNFIITMSRY
jgi:hypothetical protein